MTAFADGKPSEEEYETALRDLLMSCITFKSLVLASMTVFSMFWTILGIATAYKAAAHGSIDL